MNELIEHPYQTEQAAPLSFAQQRLWLLDRLLPTGSVYNIDHVLRISGELDPAALRGALNELVRRHEVLRTRFGMQDGQPVQVIATELKIALAIEELLEYAPDERANEARRRAQAESEAPFDLANGPLIRARLLRLTPSEHWLLLTLHHIVTDGWSSGVLRRELTTLYNAYRRGEPSPLPDLPVQYADYALWQRQWLQGAVLEKQLGFWRQALSDLPILDLPTDRPRPAEASYRGGCVEFVVPESLTHSLKALSRREGATLFMTLLAAYQILLFRYSRQEDIAIGVPIAGRTRLEVEGLIGFFVNTLVLRGDLSGEPSFKTYLAQVRTRALDAYEHQDLPFEKLVEELAPKRDLSRNPLFQASLVLQNTPPEHWQILGLDVQRVEEIRSDTAKFDLSMNLTERAGVVMGRLEYATDLFDTATIERMAGHFLRLLDGIAANPECGVGELPLLTAPERHQLLVEWNDTAVDYPRDQTIHRLFEQQVEHTPEAKAVVFAGQQLTYSELNARANQLAHHLQSLGVGPDVLVGLCLDRSLELVVGLMGILKAGGAYVPLDPGYPAARLAFMLEDTHAPVLLTERPLLARLPKTAARVVCLDCDRAAIALLPATDPPATAAAENLAYVIYTSGSTGIPKGVMIEHRAVANHMEWMRRTFGFDCRDSVLQKTPISFDAAMWEFLAPLLSGGRLVMAPPDAHRDPAAIVRALHEHEVTTIQLVPSLFRLLAKEPLLAACGKLARMFCGGEALAIDAVKRFFERSGARLYNLYGPTETCIDATSWECTRDDACAAVPIGRPIANTTIYVLDQYRQPVPVGLAGELYIGGEGQARGYLGLPELTAERFVPNPFAQRPDARMYRTGDRARYLANGNIEFLGRLDLQVKLRGFRIEPGEIEAVLARHEQVREALVMLREDTPGDQRLVAYVVARGDAITTSDLRTWLTPLLPDYMLPSAFVFMAALPLTPNGKIDRKMLPAPDAAAYSLRAYEAPVGKIETTLAQIWADVLKLERVGRHDDFFELGGHSLLAVGMLERMRQAGLHADIRALFVTPTLTALATSVSVDGRIVEVPPNCVPPACAAITPEMLPLVELTCGDIGRIVDAVPGGAVNIQDIYPLAPLQEGILFHHLMTNEGDPYLLSALFGFESRALLQRYLQALQSVIDRHDILRTAVLWEGLPEPVQVVWRHARLDVREVSIATAAGDIAQQLRARFNPRHYRLDVRQAPLMRVFIAHDAANARWLMLWLSHHLSSDHTTLEVVQQEIQAHLLGQASQLPAPLPFRNFVAQTRLGVSREEHKAFFRKMLGDVDEPTTPFGLTDVYGDGSGIAEARRRVDASLARRLRERARALGVGAASICHLAWAQVLARLSGREDVVFGTLLFGRMEAGAGADRVLGLFINTLPVRLRLGDEGVQDSVRHTHALLGQLLRHEHAPLALAQRCSGVAPPSPLFSALLNYRHSAAAARVPVGALQARDGIESLGGEERTNYPLTLSVDDLGEGFALKAQVQSPIDPQRVCAFMHIALEQLVGALESAPTTPLRNLDVMPESERHQLLVEWNATATDYPRDQCIHRLIEQQVERMPEKVAVVFDDQQLTYAALNARANKLAHHLRTLGVGPDVLVGICLERSLELVIGLLGILKAGGAYVPLDPSYPKERLAFMLSDTGARVLLTRQALLAQLPQYDGLVISLDREWPGSDTHIDANLPTTTNANSLAYVMYTSGSTGMPKGVMVPHRGITRLVCNTDYAQLEPGDCVAQVSNPSFDAATFEIWGALANGSRLVVISREVALDPPRLADELRRCKISTLFLTTALFNEVVRSRPSAFAGIKQVLFGGEVVDARRVGECLRAGAPRRLLHVYGPTETVTFATWYLVEEVASGDQTIPIGRPVANTVIYVLDDHRQPVPVGVTGELYIGGDGVARGYWRRPELTAERFVPDPFSTDRTVRLYRTGDLVRRLPDGNIVFLGRLDHQVKLRGFRIEPGEIEAALVQHEQVRDALVVLREDVPGEPRLAAYVVGREGGLATGDLRAWLKQQLPDYMIPAAFVLLPTLPLTANGKIDRRALPAPPSELGESKSDLIAPHDKLELHLAKIWEDLLKLDRIDVRDNFFDVGGHSLLAVQLMDRIDQAFHRRLPLDTLWFRGGTIEALARILRGESASGPDPELVLLKTGSRRPLFIVHTMGGNLFHYYDLARHLDAEQTVYGLQARGVYGTEPPDHTIEAIATHCIESMRTVQPQGPYLVAGFSSGGVVAFEVAQQLAAGGQGVALLALLDTYAPKTRTVRLWIDELAAVRRRKLNLRQIQELAYFSVLRPLRLDRLRQLRTVGEAHRWAHWSYRPQAYPHPIEFFIVKDSANRAATDNLGWARWTNGNLRIHHLPGHHRSMLRPPVVADLAARLQACIDRAADN